MQCSRCGVFFQNLDLVLGNCRKTGSSSYVHAYPEDCGADDSILSPGRRSTFTTTLIFPPVPMPTAIIQDTATPVPPVSPVFVAHDEDSDDDHDDDTYDLEHDRMDTAIRYGHLDNRYWVEYAGVRYEGRRTKHMKGVLLAIADVHRIPVVLPTAQGYRDTGLRPVATARVERIIVGDVMATLPLPFAVRYTRNKKWVLQYKQTEIKDRIKAVLAGYIVALRTFQA